MLEPVFKSSPYFQVTKQTRQKSGQMMVINKAFQSLSFRGKRGYSSDLLNNKGSACQRTSCELESYICKRQFKASTYGAILRIRDKSGNDLYALVQGRYTGKWSFPKGHSNEGEEPIECTLREVGEETGIDKLPDPLEYLQIGYGNYFVFDLKESIPLIPRDTQEIMDTKWVSLDEMERMSLNADASLYRKKLASFKSD
jgi:8-oxo-dGTP pyrophosphatase MutT (NUDIX family)